MGRTRLRVVGIDACPPFTYPQCPCCRKKMATPERYERASRPSYAQRISNRIFGQHPHLNPSSFRGGGDADTASRKEDDEEQEGDETPLYVCMSCGMKSADPPRAFMFRFRFSDGVEISKAVAFGNGPEAIFGCTASRWHDAVRFMCGGLAAKASKGVGKRDWISSDKNSAETEEDIATSFLLKPGPLSDSAQPVAEKENSTSTTNITTVSKGGKRISTTVDNDEDQGGKYQKTFVNPELMRAAEARAAMIAMDGVDLLVSLRGEVVPSKGRKRQIDGSPIKVADLGSSSKSNTGEAADWMCAQLQFADPENCTLLSALSSSAHRR